MPEYKYTPIIFETALAGEELSAYRDVKCYSFLVKPFGEEEFVTAFRDALGLSKQMSQQAKTIQIEQKQFILEYVTQDIAYIEAFGKKLVIHTSSRLSGIKEDTISGYTLSGLLALLDDPAFVQCHKSYIGAISDCARHLHCHKTSYNRFPCVSGGKSALYPSGELGSLFALWPFQPDKNFCCGTGNWNFRCVRLWYRGRYFNADDCRNSYVGLQENIELGGQNMSSYIEVKNVSKSFSGRAILQNISLPVEQGTTVGLVGANGSGKSVLFKIICGFEKPDQGSVYVRGNQLGKNGCDFPESLGVFINSPGFIGIYNGFQNLKFLADIQGKIGEKEIRQAMSKVGLDPDNKTKVDNYSLGMKQKLGLAQAIMEGQDILILDEPFNALDYKTYEDVKAIIRMLKAEGKTIFLTSHHYKDIEQLCDQVYSLEDCQLLPITEEIAARYREMD